MCVRVCVCVCVCLCVHVPLHVIQVTGIFASFPPVLLLWQYLPCHHVYVIMGYHFLHCITTCNVCVPVPECVCICKIAGSSFPLVLAFAPFLSPSVPHTSLTLSLSPPSLSAVQTCVESIRNTSRSFQILLT